MRKPSKGQKTLPRGPKVAVHLRLPPDAAALDRMALGLGLTRSNFITKVIRGMLHE